MYEERLGRMEGLMEQLIKMVGESIRKVDESNRKADESLAISNETLSIVLQEREISEKRHDEIMKELQSHSGAIDYLREMTSKHDMEIHKLKSSN
ncbi:hypothetical protein RZN25_17785 [Bacillaceae bacterium S4-13-56]